MTIGGAIKAARDIKNVTLPTLSQKADIPQNHLKAFENGSRMPTEEQQNKIFDALEIHIDVDDEGEYFFPDYEEGDKKINKIGYCAFCGQSQLIETDKYWPQEVRNRYATEHCNCDAARAAARKKEAEEERLRERQRRINSAVLDIQNMISDIGLQDVASILQQCVPKLIDDVFRKVTISVDTHTTVMLCITANDKICVERRVTNVDRSETE